VPSEDSGPPAEPQDARPEPADRLLGLLDELKELIATSPRIPFSDRAAVSSAVLLELVEALRHAMPRAVLQAERVLQMQRRVLASARGEADELLESAREDAELHAQEHAVVEAARLQAERIVERSRHEADALMLSADQRVEQLFSQLEGRAVELARQLRSTRPPARAAAGATPREPG